MTQHETRERKGCADMPQADEVAAAWERIVGWLHRHAPASAEALRPGAGRHAEYLHIAGDVGDGDYWKTPWIPIKEKSDGPRLPEFLPAVARCVSPAPRRPWTD
jgi:cell wall assembly regulator SMI1